MTATPVDTRSAPGTSTELDMPTGGRPTEASLLPRFVALLTPLFAIAAGALASWVARRTGAQLDSAGITAFMVTASTSVVGASWKWLRGWQQHELLVAEGRDVPRRAGPAIDAR